MTWRKSTFSHDNGCVELADFGPQIGVRDSKDPEGPQLRLDKQQLGLWLDGIRAGELDDCQ